jgi:hypothetical protein
VLDARARYQNSEFSENSEFSPAVSLADLYAPSAMPKVLMAAHRALDKTVDACYRRESFKSELERLEFLFRLDRQSTEPLSAAMASKPKRKKK